jgi:hypothetical protein
MARKTKLQDSPVEDLLVEVSQTFSGEDEVAFEFAEAEDDDAGFFFEADFDMEEK